MNSTAFLFREWTGKATILFLDSTGTHSVLAGEIWNFQCWYRDKNPNATPNFTDAVSVLFQ